MGRYNRENIIENLTKDVSGCTVKKHAPKPKVTYASVEKNRILCRTNVCGNYNTSWTCPPNCGTSEYCIGRINAYKDADILMVKYDNVDFNDHDMVEGIMTGFRDTCRDIMTECRKEGFDVLVFADGPCSYCKECAFAKGKNCYHPDKQVPSVSGYGINMTEYMKEIGIEFSFAKDSVTLYGIILFK